MTQAIWGISAALMRAWLKKMRPKWSRSGKTSAWCGRFAPAAVHQIDAGQPVLGGDLLGAEVLLDRQRKVGAALHRGSLAAIMTSRPETRPTPAIMPAPGRLAVVEAVGGQLADLQKGEPTSSRRSTRSRGSSLPRAVVALARGFGPPEGGFGHLGAEFGGERPVGFGVGGEGGRGGVDGGDELGHARRA
jgi:hypothetical protein